MRKKCRTCRKMVEMLSRDTTATHKCKGGIDRRTCRRCGDVMEPAYECACYIGDRLFGAIFGNKGKYDD